jgi:hypothetical protein
MLSRQLILKQEMKAKLRTEPDQFEHTVLEFELVNGKPVAASFEWDGDDEFWYNGSIYDIIEKRVTGNKLRIRCIDDTQEAALIKKMEALEKTSPGNNKSDAFALEQLLSLVLFNQHNFSEPVSLFSQVLQNDHYRESFNNIIIDIKVPPPRIMSPFGC